MAELRTEAGTVKTLSQLILEGFDDWPAYHETQGTHHHDSYACPAHVRGCECATLAGWLCNPYCVIGFCPDAIELMPDDVGTTKAAS